jgi:hypothetical protein
LWYCVDCLNKKKLVRSLPDWAAAIETSLVDAWYVF